MKNRNLSQRLIFVLIALTVFSCRKEAPDDMIHRVPESSLANHHDHTALTNAALTGLPDLIVDEALLASSIVFKKSVFKSNSRAVIEGLLTGTGKRNLVRFDVAVQNIGDADLFLGDPADNPALFTLSSCHGHYHLNGFANYELLSPSGTPVVAGRKQAFCLMDTSPCLPNAGPAQYDCGYQGISAGWQDIYGSYLDGQWLDITGVPRGNYVLRVTVNPDRILNELDFVNNSASVPVIIPR